MTHYTTIEQSKKLVELGLSPESADMVYIMFDGKPLDDDAKLSTVFESKDNKWYWIDFIDGSWDICEEDIPCWSLGALLEVMPDGVQTNSNRTGVSVDMTFVHNGIVTDSHHVKNNTFLEAAFNMVVWLLKNNYIKKGE